MIFSRKSLYLIAVASLGMSAFQLAVAETPTAEPTGSSYPSDSAYPSESSYPSGAPTEASIPSMSPVVPETLSPSTSPVVLTFAPTMNPTSSPTTATTVSTSIKVCPADCGSLEELANSPAFLRLMAECYVPFAIIFARFVRWSGCAPCLGDARGRILQDGGGSTLTFEFTSDDPMFTEITAAQAFADNLAGLPDVAEGLQPGLTMDPATLFVGTTLVQSLTGAPTMAPTKGPKDSKKGKKDKKKKDKKAKKTKAPTDAPKTKAPKAPKKGKKEKSDKTGKTEKKEKR